MANLTEFIEALRPDGKQSTSAELLPLVYDELRKLAASKLAHEKPGQTLQATALVHEAFLRLSTATGGPCWDGPGHFFAAAAEAMRRIMVDSARRKSRIKHGGELQRCDLDLANLLSQEASEEVLGLDEALLELAKSQSEKAELVKLRYFAGLTSAEAAAVLNISTATADRHWRYARAWLAQRLRTEQ